MANWKIEKDLETGGLNTTHIYLVFKGDARNGFVTTETPQKICSVSIAWSIIWLEFWFLSDKF